jgi:hypothetical protein
VYIYFEYFSPDHREEPSSLKKLCVDFSRWLAVDRDGWEKEKKKEILFPRSSVELKANISLSSIWYVNERYIVE